MTQKCIVYIDDEKDLTELFVDLFETPDCNIYPFNNPVSAFDFLKENSICPCGFFLDYRMPQLNGEQTAIYLEENLQLMAPKILLSGDLEMNLKFKFAQVLSKPFDTKKIENLIKDLLR